MAGKKVTDREYEHVLKVCDRFDMQTMKEYYDLH